MSNTILKNIYDTSFTTYLQMSHIFGDYIHQQSVQVENLMKAFMHLMKLAHKYKTPLNPYVEAYLKQPVINAISDVKKIAILSKDYEFHHHLVFISETVDLFEWINVSTNTDKFIESIIKNAQANRDNIELALKSLSDIHTKWYKSWLDTFDELTVLIASFYKGGFTWQGDLKYPSSDMFADVATMFKMGKQQMLMNNTNEGETFLRSFKSDMVQEAADVDIQNNRLQVFKKEEKKWRIEHQKDDHKNLTINSISSEELVFIYNCENCTIVIANEIKSVHLDRCKKIALFLRSNLHSVELIDVQDSQVHCCEPINKIDLTSCEDICIIGTDKVFDVQIYTEKCLGIFVNFPTDDNRFFRYKICEKFVSTIMPHGGIKTVVVNNES